MGEERGGGGIVRKGKPRQQKANIRKQHSGADYFKRIEEGNEGKEEDSLKEEKERDRGCGFGGVC